MDFYQSTVVSSIGTSILTNRLRNMPDPPVEMLKRTANYKWLDDFSSEERGEYESHRTVRRNVVLDGEVNLVRTLSAELNGIYALDLPFGTTHHLLLCTDTVQGKATAEIIREKLKQLGVRSVESGRNLLSL